MSGPVEDGGPSRLGYLLGALAIVLGIAGAGVFFVLGIRSVEDDVDGFVRIAAPASGELQIDETGGVTVYVEDGTASLTLTAPDGSTVSLEPYDTELTYDIGGRSGTAVATFDATPGTYRVEAEGSGTIAIGPSVAPAIARTAVGSVLIAGLGILTGLVLLVVTAVRRSRARREATAAAAASPPGAGWSQVAPPAAANGWAAPPPPPPPAPGPATWPTPPTGDWAEPPPPPPPPSGSL